MNITCRHLLPIVLVVCSLSGCGQTGKLFLPGHGTGYYRTHEFTSRPVVAVPKAQHKPSSHKKSQDLQSSNTSV